MRNMANTSNEEAKKSGWKIIVPFPGELVGKATLEDTDNGINIMKSTKRFTVPGGWLYNVSTEIHTQKGVAIAEALAFVPEK